VAEWLWRVTQDLSSSRAMRAHSHVERREGSNPSDSIILFDSSFCWKTILAVYIVFAWEDKMGGEIHAMAKASTHS
jgi:hypothetical protein